jgi:hypothetical protein
MFYCILLFEFCLYIPGYSSRVFRYATISSGALTDRSAFNKVFEIDVVILIYYGVNLIRLL